MYKKNLNITLWVKRNIETFYALKRDLFRNHLFDGNKRFVVFFLAENYFAIH